MDDQEAPPARRPLTYGMLGFAALVCLAWWVAGFVGFFGYAAAQSDTAPVAGCDRAECPTQRDALLTLGLFGLVPLSVVGFLASLVVLVYAARSLRRPWLLGSVSALAGMAVAGVVFLLVATHD